MPKLARYLLQIQGRCSGGNGQPWPRLSGA
jgi:hypothetical protein